MLARLISHSQLLSVAGAEGGGIQAGYALLSELTALLLELESAILRLPARIGDDLRCKPALDELQVLLSKVVQYRAECEDTSRHLEAALSELVQATPAPAPHCGFGCSNERACSPSSLPALESAQPASLTSVQDQAQGQGSDRDQDCDVLLRVRRVICSLALDVEVGAQAQHGGLDAELLALREAMRRDLDLDLDLEVEVGRHEEALAATTASGVGLQQQQSREEEEPQPEAPARAVASADCPMAEQLAGEGEVRGPGCLALVRRGSRRARDWAPGGPTGPAGPEAPLGPHWAPQGLGRVERLHAARHVSRRLAAQHLARLKQQREQQQGQGMQHGQALGGQQLQLQSHPLAPPAGSTSSAAAQEPQSQQAGRVPVPVPVAGALAQLGGAEGRADGDEPPAVRQRRGEVVGAHVRSLALSRSHAAAVVASSSDAHATADVEGDRSADSSSDNTWGGLRVSCVKPAPQTPVGETVRVPLPGPLGAWPAPHPHAQNPVPSPSPSPRLGHGHGQGHPWPATPSSPVGPTPGHTPASVAALRKLNRVTRLAGMWEAGGPLAAVPDGAPSPSGDDGDGDGSCSFGSEASTSGRLSDGEDAVRRAAGPRRRRTAGEQPHVPASPPPLPLPPAPPQLRQPQPELVPLPGFVAKAAAPHGGAALSPFLMLAMQGRAPQAPPPPVLERMMACPVEASWDGAGAGRKQGAGDEEELPAAPAAAAAGVSPGVSPTAAAAGGHRRAAPFAAPAPAPLPLPDASVHLRAVGLPGWALPYAPHHWPPAGPLGPPGGFGPGFGLPHPHPHAPSGPDAPSPSPCNPLDLDLDLGLDLGPHVPSLDLHRDVTAWGPCLGRGAFGAVYKALYRNRPVAVKVLHGGGLDSGDLRSLTAEIRLLAQPRLRDHPHVIRVLGAAAAPPDHFALVTELMDCDLYDYIHRRRQNCVPLDEVLHIARSIAAGLAGLHPGIVHRDLKPANVLLRHTPAAAAGPGGAARLVVKIADFGLARYKRSTYLSTRHRDAGTLKYMAPEAMQAGGSRGVDGGEVGCGSSGGVTEKCDIYSFGVLLYELITGREPWEGYHPLFAVCQVQSGATLPLPDDPARCPPALRALVLRCWAAQHAARPSAAEAVAALDDMIAQHVRHDGGGGGAPEVVAAVAAAAAAAAGSLQA